MPVRVQQEWRDVEEFTEVAVTEDGQVMNTWNGHILTPRCNQQGFLMVGVMFDRKQYTRSVALMVANAFLEPPRSPAYNSIIHLNGDRSDCRALNLMWRPRWFATKYHRMFDDLPFRVSAYIPKIDQHFPSLRELCTTYGLLEQESYHDIINQTPCFHYGWLIERSEKYKY